MERSEAERSPPGTSLLSLSSSYAYLKEILPDHAEDFELLEVSIIRESGRQAIIDLHVRGIIQHINQFA